jgi:hypothetical protein
MNPAIVVDAYQRPLALRRLLAALTRAEYPGEARIPLVISIDRGPDAANAEVVDAAREFAWPHGPKEVIHQPEPLGLVGHFFFCGGLSEKYGAVIFLEDDLGVSPVFYHYAAQALRCFDSEPRVGGVSLYTLWFNGYTHHPFEPLSDASDAFFLQVPYTQGQAWTAAQWSRFTTWRAEHAGQLRPAPGDALHPLWFTFDREDQFPIMTRYLVQTGQFYAYPRVSHTTGFGDAGVHFDAASSYFQVPLQRGQTEYQFQSFADSNCVYDSFFELLPDRLARLAPDLQEYDLTVDLNATKPAEQIHSPYILTTRPARRAERTFGLRMRPMEANIIEGIPGEEISLCQAEDIQRGSWAEWRTRQRLHAYFSRGRRLGRRAQLQFALVEWVGKLKEKSGNSDG